MHCIGSNLSILHYVYWFCFGQTWLAEFLGLMTGAL